MKKCENCENLIVKSNVPESIPYIVYEGTADRLSKQIKRWMIAFFVALTMLFITNIGWLIYESQFETIEYSQDGNGQNNINTGNQGDVINESTAPIKIEED